ncbi:MAG: ROK family protein [Pseudomonadota bacterium]
MRLGIDLGGTKIEGVLLDRQSKVCARRRVETPQGDYRATIATVRDLADHLDPDRRMPIGIGTPGSIGPESGLLRNSNSVVLNGKPFEEDLVEGTGRRVRLANDADCFALAEAMAGAGQGAASVFGVILGTGVGGGFVVNGHLLSGPNSIAGEWGHTPLPRPTQAEQPGPACYCGRFGCVETWCSGPGLSADHTRRTGESLDPAELLEHALAKDPEAQKTFALHTDRLARSLSVVVNIVDPEMIVLGGGLSNLDHLYHDLPEAMRPQIFSDSFRTRIARNRLGDSAGVIGACWLWPEQEEEHQR